MSSSSQQPMWLIFVMRFRPEGFLCIRIFMVDKLATFMPSQVWRDLDVEEFKKANRVCFVTLDNMGKELADLAAHLFNGVDVATRWHNVFRDGSNEFFYLMYPVGFDTSRIGPEYWNPASAMNLAQMRQSELETAGNNSSDRKTSEEAIDDETDDDESEDAQQEKQAKRARKKKGKKRNKGTGFDKGFSKNKKKKRK
ncbi:hypothetical protein FSHL1_011392 [Fusarium sambucinum]